MFFNIYALTKSFTRSSIQSQTLGRKSSLWQQSQHGSIVGLPSLGPVPDWLKRTKPHIWTKPKGREAIEVEASVPLVHMATKKWPWMNLCAYTGWNLSASFKKFKYLYRWLTIVKIHDFSQWLALSWIESSLFFSTVHWQPTPPTFFAIVIHCVIQWLQIDLSLGLSPTASQPPWKRFTP